jgi:hypothetical protein
MIVAERAVAFRLNSFAATFRNPYSGTRGGLAVLRTIKTQCRSGFLTHSGAKPPALCALRLAFRRPPRVAAHPVCPRRTRKRHAQPDLVRRTGATVEAVIPKGPERRLRCVTHRTQLVRRHPPWIAPDRITIGPDFGAYSDLRLGRLGHSRVSRPVVMVTACVRLQLPRTHIGCSADPKNEQMQGCGGAYLL